LCCFGACLRCGQEQFFVPGEMNDDRHQG
jgi:hypothetical protein